MDQTQPNNYFTSLKTFLIEKKNQKMFLLSLLSIFIFFIVIFFFTIFVISSRKVNKKKVENTVILPTPTKEPDKINEESIQSLGYTIDCQLVVTTSVKKIYIKKLDRCSDVLDYKIAPSKKYAAYLLIDKNKTAQFFTYSLENNVEGLLQIVSQPIVTYQFDTKDNLSILFALNKQTN